MSYIAGQHWVLCHKCLQQFRWSELKKDRTGRLTCKKDYDMLQVGYDIPMKKIRPDPRPLNVNRINEEGLEIFVNTGTWGEVDEVWEDVSRNWEDM